MANDAFEKFSESYRLVWEQEKRIKELQDLNSRISIDRSLADQIKSSLVSKDRLNLINSVNSAIGLASLSERMTGLGGLGKFELASLGTDLHFRSLRDQLTRMSDVRQLTGFDQNLGTLGIDKALGAGNAYSELMQSIRSYNERFRLPGLNETARLLADVNKSINQQYGLSGSLLEASLLKLRQPWLDAQNELGSIGSIAKLHGIGHLISTQSSFAPSAAAALRIDLGDWRDRLTWPRTAATDAIVRSEFYFERGYNSALSEFPIDTFEEGLESSGLRDEPLLLVAAYGEPVSRSEDENEETEFARNNVIHDWIQRFETQIRRFIDKVMTAQFGSSWPQHHLPNGLYDKWLDKQSKDASGRTWPLVYYADFTDYELIICKRDNWRVIFAQYFVRQEHVRESLQRLYLPRIAAMHSRPLMLDDELFVFAEIKRLVRLFGI